MESKYNYFKRDISWLSFNYRVLLEALDERLPLYERINFISIYSSNLEEFYKIRVADHKAVASGATESDEETVQSARELVEEINKEVTRQLDDRVRIYEEKLLPALRKNHIIFYQDRHVEPFHQQFIKGTQLVFGCFIVPGSATGNIGNTFYIFDQIRFTADILSLIHISEPTRPY